MHSPPLFRKFTVFVSSVTAEFEVARKALWGATYQAGHIPVIMESLPATSQDIHALIHKRIEESNIFVLLVGQQYGKFVVEGKVQSFIDMELNHAIHQGLPVIVFEILADDTAQVTPKDTTQEAIDDSYKRLLATARTVAAPKVVRPDADGSWSGLCKEFVIALQHEASRRNRGGWIPATMFDAFPDIDFMTLAKAVSGNPFFQRFVERLQSFTTISQRTTRVREQKEAIADFFWDQFLPRLRLQNITKLFFESGSTIAYLSQEFILRLARPWVRKFSGELTIETNNVLTYLDFLLIDPNSDPVDVSLFPGAPAEEYYGATFGKFTSLVELYPPEKPRKLADDAAAMIEERIAELKTQYRKNGLILMTASGLEMASDSKFPGPHVGSYYNELMKRSLLGCGAPVVLFLEDSKLPRGFEVGQCFSVCDEFVDENSWRYICEHNPIAIVTCSSTESGREEKLAALSAIGFRHVQRGKERNECWPVIVANEKFASRFKMM